MKSPLLAVMFCVISGCAADASSSGTPDLPSPVAEPLPAGSSGGAPSGAAGAAAGNAGSPADPTAPTAGSMAPTTPPVAGSPAEPSAGAAAPAAGGAAAGAPPQASYEVLMSGEWTLEPGAESTRTCVKKLLTEDVYVSAIRPISPPGTHHSLLSMGQDPASDCTESVAEGLIYAAAAGTEGLLLPPGVAIKLPAGMTLKLGLHVFNASDAPLTGTSGLEILTLQASEVEHESQAVLVGPVPLLLPPKMNTVVKSTCTLTGQQTVFAVFPHMHEYGRHLKTTVVANGISKVIHDGAFEFGEQRQYPLELMTLNANDTITTECTFENTSDNWVEFGESTTTEMCISVVFAYPPVGTGICLGLPE
jgi:hypothetical protein